MYSCSAFSIAQECSGSFVNISMHNSTKLPLRYTVVCRQYTVVCRQYTVVCRQYTVSMQTVYSRMQTVYSRMGVVIMKHTNIRRCMQKIYIQRIRIYKHLYRVHANGTNFMNNLTTGSFVVFINSGMI